jgi:PAS domain S-box-containing protein
MNVIFASQEASEVKLLKIRLSKLSRPSQDDASSNAREIPADLRYVIVKQIGVTSDGLLKLPENGSFLGDIIVVDAAITGARTQEAVKDAASKAPGVPIILLTDPEDEVSIIDALSAGATDCIPKTNKYLHRLLPVVEREIRRGILAREKTDISSREERLRQIVERVPVGVSVIAPDGTFLAINQTGLKLMGAAQLNQIVGKNFLHFIAQEDREKILEFLTTVSNGTNASILLDWKGLDGTGTVLKLIATPMLKQGISGAAVLTGIYSTEDFPKNEKSEEETQENEELKKALQELDVRFKELQEEHTLQKSKWEAAGKQDEAVLQELEQRAREAEEQRAALQATLQESEGRRTELENTLREIEEHRNRTTEDYSTERSQWEQIKQELEQKAREAEEQRAALQATLRESEGRRTELETALHESEEKRRQQANDFDAERSRWGQTRQQWDQKFQEINEQRVELENALREIEEHRDRTTEDYSTERSQWERIKQELEQKARETEEQRAALQADLRESEGRRTEMETALHESEEKRRQQAEDFDAERSRWEQTRQQWDQKFQEIDEQRAEMKITMQEAGEQLTAIEKSLRESEEKRKQQAEAFNTERSQWERIKQELEQKARETDEQQAGLRGTLQGSEGQQTALETALRESEEKQKQLAEANEIERSQWEQTRLEWEQRLRQSEEQHSAQLQKTIQEAEDRYGRIFEESRSKESQLEELRQRVQQLKSDLHELQSEFSKGRLGHQRLLENTSAGILQTTLEGRVLDCNETAARMFGYDGIKEAMSQTDENKVFSIYSYQGIFKERLLQEGRLENIEWSSLDRNGRLIRFRENAVLMKNPKGEGFLVERVLTDRTQFYMLHEENRRMRKVGSTTDLVGAAVKNLNNLCESLAQCGKLLKDAPDDGNSVRQVAEKLLKDATWGSKHAHQFFEASMKADQNPAVINLNEILSENDTLLHNLVGEDIDLQIMCSPDLSLVMAERQKMIQLISNFVVSSLKILPLGGAVTIETENVEIDESVRGQSSEIPPGIYVRMTISIDGCEILAERRLTHNKSIVDRMGGWIETLNDPQSGNMYKIYFPRIEAFAGETA